MWVSCFIKALQRKGSCQSFIRSSGSSACCTSVGSPYLSFSKMDCKERVGRCFLFLFLAVLFDVVGLALLLIGIFAPISFWDFFVLSGPIIIFLSLVFWIFWYMGNLTVPYHEILPEWTWIRRGKWTGELENMNSWKSKGNVKLCETTNRKDDVSLPESTVETSLWPLVLGVKSLGMSWCFLHLKMLPELEKWNDILAMNFNCRDLTEKERKILQLDLEFLFIFSHYIFPDYERLITEYHIHSSWLFWGNPVMHFMEDVGKPQVKCWVHRHWLLYWKLIIYLLSMSCLFQRFYFCLQANKSTIINLFIITNKSRKWWCWMWKPVLKSCCGYFVSYKINL